jgi:hypothetical protein
LRTSVASERFKAAETVLACKRLATVERTFRSFKSVDLEVRPIHHRLPHRVRAHGSLALLAYYVERHRLWLPCCLMMSSAVAAQLAGRAGTTLPRAASQSAKQKNSG